MSALQPEPVSEYPPGLGLPSLREEYTATLFGAERLFPVVRALCPDHRPVRCDVARQACRAQLLHDVAARSDLGTRHRKAGRHMLSSLRTSVSTTTLGTTTRLLLREVTALEAPLADGGVQELSVLVLHKVVFGIDRFPCHTPRGLVVFFRHFEAEIRILPLLLGCFDDGS